jgi:hypothetical protein
MNKSERPWLKGLIIALGGAMIFTVVLGLLVSLTLLVVSMEEGGETFSRFSLPLTLALMLLTQGAGFHAGSITLSIIPLLLTVLLVWLLASLTRRLSRSPKSYLSGLLVWLVINWLFTQNIVVVLEDSLWIVLVKAGVVFTIGFLLGALPQAQLISRARQWVNNNLPPKLISSLKLGLSNAVILILGYIVIGLITVLVWVIANQSAVVRLFHMTNMGMGSRIITSICTLAWLPNLCLWALSWLFGGTFVVGDLASFSLWSDHAFDLPAVPVFAIFPQALSNDTLRLCLIAIPMICGLLLAIVELFLPKCFAISAGKPDEPFNPGNIIGQFIYPLLSFFLTSALMAFVVNILFVLSSGSLGQHRLAHVGVDPIASSRVVCLSSAVGFLGGWFVAIVLIALVFGVRITFNNLHTHNAATEKPKTDSYSTEKSSDPAKVSTIAAPVDSETEVDTDLDSTQE